MVDQEQSVVRRNAEMYRLSRHSNGTLNGPVVVNYMTMKSTTYGYTYGYYQEATVWKRCQTQDFFNFGGISINRSLNNRY